ncbi:MAG: hypothetical protein ACXVO9_14635, partial [Bacteroidia bacterium]
MKNKNTFRFIYLLCFLYINSYSQYKKFSLNNMAYWREQFVESVPGGMNMQEYQYGIKNDTIINFKPYNQVYVSYIGPLFQQGNGSGPYFPNLSFIRQDTILRKIFILNSQNQEFVLFNFNKNIGDTLNVYDIVSGIKTLTVSIRDSLILSDGLYHTRFKYAPNNIT